MPFVAGYNVVGFCLKRAFQNAIIRLIKCCCFPHCRIDHALRLSLEKLSPQEPRQRAKQGRGGEHCWQTSVAYRRASERASAGHVATSPHGAKLKRRLCRPTERAPGLPGQLLPDKKGYKVSRCQDFLRTASISASISSRRSFCAPLFLASFCKRASSDAGVRSKAGSCLVIDRCSFSFAIVGLLLLIH